MKYAKIVLGLPVEGPFDYIVPNNLEQRIKPGMRVWVPFGKLTKVGYVISLSRKSLIKKLKPIKDIIDSCPLLNPNLLRLSKNISNYYCCSLGEAIELTLPQVLRKGKPIPIKERSFKKSTIQKPQRFKKGILLIKNGIDANRFQIFGQYIKRALKQGKNVIFITPEINLFEKTLQFLKMFNKKAVTLHSNQKVSEQVSIWQGILNQEVRILLGTRIAIFAPLYNIGLVIIDHEDSQNLKQQQHPCYHVKDIAIMRSNIEGFNIILASNTPSLESYYRVKTKEYEYLEFQEKGEKIPKIKIIKHQDFLHKKRRPFLLSSVLESEINNCLKENGKVLLFLNRRGYFSYAGCKKCGFVLRCERCSSSLIYYYKEKKLICRWCNKIYKLQDICPNCQSSYIRYQRAGTEKIESQLVNLFPQYKIHLLENNFLDSKKDFDILISTSAIIHKEPLYKFDLLGILSIDNSLNRTDFHATEKTFLLLKKLTNLCQNTMIIQTSFPEHYCFSMLSNDASLFYNKELSFRKSLNFPPFAHFININIRGKKESTVVKKANILFDRLTLVKNCEVFPPIAQIPLKLRGNFRYQMVLKTKSPKALSYSIRKIKNELSSSSVIITVDVDPI